MNNFAVIEEKISENGEEHLSYGISFPYEDGMREIRNITVDKEKIDFIVAAFNKEQPQAMQIDDILENYLLDFTDF